MKVCNNYSHEKEDNCLQLISEMSNPFETSSNPFEDDDDYPRKSESGESLSHEDSIQRIMQEIQDSEDRQLDSTRRALASIDDSERTGIATAEVPTVCLNIESYLQFLKNECCLLAAVVVSCIQFSSTIVNMTHLFVDKF